MNPGMPTWAQALLKQRTKPILRDPAARLIEAFRKALADYDYETNRRGTRVDLVKVAYALADLDAGLTIRQAARKNSISFGALWRAKERRAGRR